MTSSASSTPAPCVDWFGVWAGYTNYDDKGCAVPQDAPQGVRLAIQPAQKVGPFFTRERPWEAVSPGIATVLYEQGRYRMWYGSDIEGGCLCYAESTDGLNWERPNLGLVQYRGSKENNILSGGQEFFPDSIICDLTAPDQERYKAIDAAAEFRVGGAVISKAEARHLMAEAQKAGDAAGHARPAVDFRCMLMGAVSADGIRWQRIDKPLLTCTPNLDTQNILAYDMAAGRYLAYLRGGLGRRRSVRRSTSHDFREGWEEPRLVLLMDAQDAPDDDIYTTAYCKYPGGGLHLMFPSIYHRISDVLDIQLAVSRDGLNWARPERKPIVDREAVCANGERVVFGSIYAAPSLLPLGEDEWGLPLYAYRRNHNQALGPDGEFWWAKWKRDRLAALGAVNEGRVTLVERECSGDRLLVNYSTEQGGWLKFELTENIPNREGIEAPPLIPGYSFADCAPLRGDSLGEADTWRGSSSLARLKGRQIAVRVHMFRARLFATSI